MSCLEVALRYEMNIFFNCIIRKLINNIFLCPEKKMIASDDKAYKWIVLLITSVGSMMGPLDGSIVNVSLPVIADHLNMDYVSVIWVPAAYLLTLSVLLLIIGRLSDIHGRKWIFIAGFAVFVFGSFLCSIATNGPELIFFRILQGGGGACIFATSPAIVTDVFPAKERGKALGLNVMAIYIGSALGPTLGGVLTYTLGWQSIFLVNIPIGLFIISLSLWKLKESHEKKPQPFDLTGTAVFAVSLISLLVVMTMGEPIGWTSIPVLSLFIVVFFSFALFVFVEVRKGSNAMFDIALITHNRLFAAANLAALLNYTAFFATSLLISFYLQRVLGFSTLMTGGILLATPVIMAFLSPLSGWISDRIGSRFLSTSGMIVIGVGLLLLSTLKSDTSIERVILYLLIIGAGMGLFSSPNTSAIMGSVSRKQLGIASGTLATMRTTGQALSLAVTGAVVATVASSKVVSLLFIGTNSTEIGVGSIEYVQGMSLAFVVCASIAFIGAIFSFIRGKAIQVPTEG
jgi:EmrB/QacA subfamily drug resistance transporter